MEQKPIRDQRVMWAFWIAAALVAVGAVAPLAFSIGAHTRLTNVIIPFAVAAVALGINAVMYHQGRSLTATLYFIAGLAIVYGILAMAALPLRLAVVGTCPPEPAKCPLGFEPPMTDAENSGLALASLFGMLAIFVGFYGLLTLYRRLGVAARPRRGALWPAKPPAQPAPAGKVAPAAAEPVAPTRVAAAPAPATSPREARARSGPEANAKPPATDEQKELPAPVEPKELPAPEPEDPPPAT